jgi:hypothetical protein
MEGKRLTIMEEEIGEMMRRRTCLEKMRKEAVVYEAKLQQAALSLSVC